MLICVVTLIYLRKWMFSSSQEKKSLVGNLNHASVYFITDSDLFILQLHPDSNPSNPTLHSQFVELNEAYRTLSKDLSRKEYDIKLQHPYSGRQVFRSASSHSTYRSSEDNVHYWEQFHHSQSPEMTPEEKKHRRRRNFRLVAYCVTTMMLSIAAHMVFFKKLEEVHSNFMDEKDRVITEIYNDAKERARVNGFRKQTEILRQKHAEFQEKYKIRNGGHDK
uniref:DnaJ heat shock protein family (Hsp40) member C4 n=1 Tax=Nothobranchius furzeri TaxID=105023 RepID=A0A8C6LB12_NOTFU